jgi:hypothetical protein
LRRLVDSQASCRVQTCSWPQAGHCVRLGTSGNFAKLASSVFLLGSIDRLCGQFAIALQHAEHEHLFLLAALIGTLTLVFPTHR